MSELSTTKNEDNQNGQDSAYCCDKIHIHENGLDNASSSTAHPIDDSESDEYEAGGRSLTCKQAACCCLPRFCPRLVDEWQFKRISASVSSGQSLPRETGICNLLRSCACLFSTSPSDKRTEATWFRFRAFFLLWDLCHTSMSTSDLGSAWLLK